MRAAMNRLLCAKLVVQVSIRAAHAGSDQVRSIKPPGASCFNPRCPCGQRSTLRHSRTLCAKFQSALPMRAAMYAIGHRSKGVGVSIRAAHAGSDGRRILLLGGYRVSIRAAHAGSDFPNGTVAFRDRCFNPRCPCGQRSMRMYGFYVQILVSIRAAHAGSDAGVLLHFSHLGCFNPRCPCGQRCGLLHLQLPPCSFNPRCPCGQRCGEDARPQG